MTWAKEKYIPFSSAFEMSCRVLGLTLLERRNLIKRELCEDGGKGKDREVGSSQVHRKLHRNIGPHLLVKSITI